MAVSRKLQGKRSQNKTRAQVAREKILEEREPGFLKKKAPIPPGLKKSDVAPTETTPAKKTTATKKAVHR